MSDIDFSLYSRQVYAIGLDTMKSIMKSNILICGLSGLGIEIAKNSILQGFGSITLYDLELITKTDIGTNYYLTEQDIGKKRIDICIDKLSELNTNVKVYKIDELNYKILKKFNVIVLVDYTIDKQIEINNFTHHNDIYFISATTIGLTGQIFCDFCQNFIIHDQDGEELQSSIIENIMNDVNPLVTCIEPHKLTNTELIKFTKVKGMTKLNDIDQIEIQYVDKFSFKLKLDTTSFGKYESGGEIIQVKQKKILNFKSLSESIISPEFIITDYTDFDRSNKLHILYMSQNELKKNIKKYNKNISDDMIEKFYLTRLGKLVPINSLIGGIASQEITKACSGKFTPIYQWLYYDALDCLPENYSKQNRNPIGSRYDNQIKVFGRELQLKLSKMKYFIVGSGAIGCELLKNFAMIGLKNLIVTDMDIIERSNLNRQFLFSNKDIGQSKSECAAKRIKIMNPDINIIGHLNKVGLETENIYNMDFYNSLDGVANALDNITSRRYVDSRCVIFCKPLLESGTLGTKGNIQVIVPFLTESYSSSSDPIETGIPLCTIKTFPNQIEHVIQWSRELFEDIFVNKPKNAQEYLKDKTCLNSIPQTNIFSFIENIKFVLDNIPETIDDVIKFAHKQWYEYYNKQIEELLFKYPKDAKTTTNTPFWIGAKKCPHSLEFDSNDKLNMDYIISFSNIWANIFDIKISDYNYNYFEEKLINLPKPEISLDNNEKEIISIEESIKSLSIYDNINININIFPQEFEKDSDTNYHIDFINAASNIRARNYDINEVDKYITKKIAGKIIPALATTTSVIAALATIELYKLAQGFNKIENYKNSFINLALPYFGFSEPIKAKVNKIKDKELTIWDVFIIHDMTLSELLNLFLTKYKIDLETIIYGNFMIYSPIINRRKIKLRMKMKIKNIIEKELEIKLDVSSITLQIFSKDENDDLELPEILYLI